VPVIAAFKAERFHEANFTLLNRLNPLATAANGASDKLVQLQLGVAKNAYDEAEARYVTIRAVSMAAMAGGLLFAMAVWLHPDAQHHPPAGAGAGRGRESGRR
jgi:hypothetical protein